MGPDILLILVAALVFILIWRGPTMLPRIGEALGRTAKNARDEIPAAIKGDDAGSADAGTADPGAGTGDSRDA